MRSEGRAQRKLIIKEMHFPPIKGLREIGRENISHSVFVCWAIGKMGARGPSGLWAFS